MAHPFVFISHAGADKHRLKPFVDALLKKLPADVKIWLDNPLKVFPGYPVGGQGRFHSIPSGEKWHEAIRHGLEGAGCVLAFWSERVAGKMDADEADVLHEELRQGLTRKKLIIVTLDERPPVRQPYRMDQCPHVPNLATEAHCRRFTEVIAQICGCIGVRPVDTAPCSIVPIGKTFLAREKLAYLADREPQIMRLEHTLQHDWNGRPLMAVIPEQRFDAPWELVDRLAYRDGPKRLKAFLQLDHERPWRTKRLTWPTPLERVQFMDGLQGPYARNIRDELGKAEAGGAPLILNAQFICSDWDGSKLKAITQWLAMWDYFFTHNRGEWADMARRLPLFLVILFTNLDRKRSGMLARLADRLLCRSIDGLSGDFAAGKRFKAICLLGSPRLERIFRQHASDWAAIDEVVSQLENPDRLVGKLDVEEFPMPMLTFAKRVANLG
jgi:TIR domain